MRRPTPNAGPASPQPALTWIAVVLGVAAVGIIDHVTGLDIHVTSLYFLPVALAGARLGAAGALAAALLSTVAWTVAQYTSGAPREAWHPWVINFCTQGAGFAAVGLLVARLQAALGREHMRAQTDGLTGLTNRRGFLDQAAAALALCRRHARPVALAYIDLDGFKRLNDSAGHEAGDALLCQAAGIIARSLRASDIAARFGGDEFVVFLPETSPDSAALLLERLRLAIETAQPFHAAGVSASVGVSCDPAGRRDLEALLARADSEMYAAKRRRNGRVSLQCWPA